MVGSYNVQRFKRNMVIATNVYLGFKSDLAYHAKKLTRRNIHMSYLQSTVYLIFYGHSLPSTDSRRAVVCFWRKNVHKYWLTYCSLCVEVLRLSQPNGVMSSTVSLPNHAFIGQA